MKIALTFILLVTLSIKGYSQNITFDNTFANNGILIIPSAATSTISVLDSDQSGNIITAGYTSQGAGTGIYKLTVSKTDKNGVLDNSFGINGVSIISLGKTVYPHAIKVLKNSKILVGGIADFPDTIPSSGFLVRLHANGSIDSSFADHGIYKLTGKGGGINSINILSDNFIMLSGIFFDIDYQAVLVKLNENGVPDSQFGLIGVLNLTAANFNFYLWQSIKTENDEIISVGYEYTDRSNLKIAYCKTDARGNYVTTFGTDGKVIKDLHNERPGDPEVLTKIIKGANNHYYLGGHHKSGILIRMNEDGSFDSTFATNGVLTHSFPYKDFDLQNNGKILVAGNEMISSGNNISVIRFNDSGSIDSTFNNGASFDIHFSANKGSLSCIKFISPNGLIIGGSSGDDFVESTLAKLKLDNTLSIQDIDHQTNFNIYPNPFTNQLNIGRIDNIKTIGIYDITGNPINFQLTTQSLYINEDIAKGIYCLKIVLKNGKQITKKLIKK